MGKRICIVSPSLKMGGIERALTVLADWFAGNGNEVYFISCLSENAFYRPSEKVKLIEPGFSYPRNKFLKTFHYIRIIHYIRRHVTRINPDAVLSFGDTFNPLVLMALIGKNFPIYISDRTSPDFNFHPGVKLGKFIFYRRASGFIAQTERSAVYNRKKYGNKFQIKVIPNAIRLVEIENINKEKMILYSGRLSVEKGPERLLEAFSAINDKKGWRLVFAGPGPMECELKFMAERMAVAGQVDFLGKVLDIDHWYSKASIYVLPSRLEGFPNSLCEAMSAGLPCICFDSIPYSDIFTNGVDGIAVSEGDIPGLTKALEHLINNPDTRLSMGNAALGVREKLHSDEIGKHLLSFMFPN